MVEEIEGKAIDRFVVASGKMRETTARRIAWPVWQAIHKTRIMILHHLNWRHARLP